MEPRDLQTDTERTLHKSLLRVLGVSKYPFKQHRLCRALVSAALHCDVRPEKFASKTDAEVTSGPNGPERNC